MLVTLPNTLSAIRLILSPVFFFLLTSGNSVSQQVSIGVFFLAALTDWYDGEIARTRNAVTNLGKFLDPLADKFLTSAAFVAFAYEGLVPWWMVTTIIVRDVLITVLRSVAEVRGVHVITSKSAQTKTFLQMTVLYYLLLLIVGRDVGWVQNLFDSAFPVLLAPPLVYILMLAVTVITVYTGIQYLYDNRAFLFGFFSSPKRVAR